MTAAAATWMLDADRAGGDAPAEFDRRTTGFLARLADFHLRPSHYLDASRLATMPLEVGQIQALAGHAAFAAPMERWIAEATGLSRITAAPAFLDRLPVSMSARLAVLLATRPLSELEGLALDLAGAVLSRRIVTLIARADRDRVRAALGEAAFALATHEAPVMYMLLGDLDQAGPRLDLQRLAAAPDGLAAYGRDVIRRYLQAQDSGLASLFDLRLPVAEASDGLLRMPVQGHIDQIVKLIRRRQPAWSAITD